MFNMKTRKVRIVYYAELGYCDGNGIGFWEGCSEYSCAFADKEDAQAWLRDHEMTETTLWGEIRPKWSYGLTRVRQAEELIWENDN